MIRVLVVDDSLTVRQRLAAFIAGHPEMQVVGQAVNGQQAVALTEQLRPDVITMDVAMPLANGVDATRQIMARCPTPIVVLSGSERSAAGATAVEALRAGALEAIQKPGPGDSIDRWAERFLETLRSVARVNAARQVRSAPPPQPVGRLGQRPVSLVAVGASTGGPKTVANILGALPAQPVPIVIVVHFPDTLFEHFIRWLDSESRMPVVGARAGMPLSTLVGKACVAVPDQHLIVKGQHLAIASGPPRNFCKPSVDVLFNSVADTIGSRTVAVLLTGMGRDGAEGMQRIQRAGGRTIAQDEATSAIFGMPKAAIDLGAADAVLPEGHIAGAIARLCSRPYSAASR